MLRNATKTQAFAMRLLASGYAYEDRRISNDQFVKNQARIWGEIHAAGLSEAVLPLIGCAK